jgi:hypothetical protein
MYYKARYYDAKIGRFLQQDSMAFPNQVNGMNRMMYVEGNPVGYRDPSGNNAMIHMFNQILKHAIFGAAKEATKASRSLGKGVDYAARKAGRGIDGGARRLASGGSYSRNKGNDIQRISYLSGKRVYDAERLTVKMLTGGATFSVILVLTPGFFGWVSMGLAIEKINIEFLGQPIYKIKLKDEYKRDTILAISCPLWGNLETCEMIAKAYTQKYPKESGQGSLVNTLLRKCEEGINIGLTTEGDKMGYGRDDKDCINSK